MSAERSIHLHINTITSGNSVKIQCCISIRTREIIETSGETEELAEACRYLLRNQIRSEEDLNSRKEVLHGRILGLEAQKGTLYQEILTGEEKKILQAYERMEDKRSEAERDYREELWESLDDKMSKMERQYPVLQWKEQEQQRRKNLQAINKERWALIREEKLLDKIQNRGG